MANFLTPPTMRKKKPDFWGGFAGALAKEVQRRAALKDAMDKLKAESDMTLQRAKDLATFNTNEGVRAAELGAPAAGRTRQSVFDIAQFGQDLTPDVAGAVASPEEQHKYIGVMPSQFQGPPTPEAEATGIGGVIAQMRNRAAEMKQNVVQTPEDVAKEKAREAKDAVAQWYKDRYLELATTREQRATDKAETAETPEQKHRQTVIGEARRIFANILTERASNPMAVMPDAKSPAAAANEYLASNGITDVTIKDPPEITSGKPLPPTTGWLQRAIDSVFGKAEPTTIDATDNTDKTQVVTPGVPTSEVEAATLLDEGRNPSTAPARREEIKKLLAEYRKRR